MDPHQEITYDMPPVLTTTAPTRRMSTGGTDLGTEILAAARNGNVHDISTLIQLGADINTQVLAVRIEGCVCSH